MNTIDLLTNLKPYIILAEELKKQESIHSASAPLSYRLTSSYSFIQVDVLDSEEQLYLRVECEVSGVKNKITEVYCKETASLPAIHALIKTSNISDAAWNDAAKATVYLNDTITHYLNIADAIAARAMNCASGDNYRPDYYSTVQVTEKEILLSQVNHMNAKSLNHKTDYSLRNFDMHIPLQDQPLPARYDHNIGAMWMTLDDRSSANNKSCGDALLEQIVMEKEKYSER